MMRSSRASGFCVWNPSLSFDCGDSAGMSSQRLGANLVGFSGRYLLKDGLLFLDQ